MRKLWSHFPSSSLQIPEFSLGFLYQGTRLIVFRPSILARQSVKIWHVAHLHSSQITDRFLEHMHQRSVPRIHKKNNYLLTFYSSKLCASPTSIQPQDSIMRPKGSAVEQQSECTNASQNTRYAEAPELEIRLEFITYILAFIKLTNSAIFAIKMLIFAA